MREYWGIQDNYGIDYRLMPPKKLIKIIVAGKISLYGDPESTTFLTDDKGNIIGAKLSESPYISKGINGKIFNISFKKVKEMFGNDSDILNKYNEDKRHMYEKLMDYVIQYKAHEIKTTIKITAVRLNFYLQHCWNYCFFVP